MLGNDNHFKYHVATNKQGKSRTRVSNQEKYDGLINRWIITANCCYVMIQRSLLKFDGLFEFRLGSAT